jgi:hypothetical protein
LQEADRGLSAAKLRLTSEHAASFPQKYDEALQHSFLQRGNSARSPGLVHALVSYSDESNTALLNPK